MTAVHIDTIHGDDFIRDEAPPRVSASKLISPLAAVRSVPTATSATLSALQGDPVYIVEANGRQTLLDAVAGRTLPPPSRQQIIQIAHARFRGDGQLVGAALIHDIPAEIRGRKPPLWRVDFSGWNKPTLYLSPTTGELVSRRHELWRVFDFLWMLHIMDYESRENVNNWLLRGMTVLALTTVVSGTWLLWFAFPRRRRKRAAA